MRAIWKFVRKNTSVKVNTKYQIMKRNCARSGRKFVKRRYGRTGDGVANYEESWDAFSRQGF